jgi:HD-GYP domain-containing protein (c-di-GMP phosphodiesterase class II)
LRGSQIMPEAYILAVADVVEAMSSHRPYRPKLPVEAALAELERGSGSRDDAAACAACIKLFRECSFTFQE